MVHNPGQRCKTVEAEDGRSREETGSRFIGLGGVDGTPVVLTKNRVREKSRETGVLGHLWPLFSRDINGDFGWRPSYRLMEAEEWRAVQI
uniref:Uncharacterized protein n=1 Tax=Cannabis sativa TaxID=3483 RepID=A0A803PRW7_CANSA